MIRLLDPAGLAFTLLLAPCLLIGFGATPLAGWFFALLGLGLAEARAYMTLKSPLRNNHV